MSEVTREERAAMTDRDLLASSRPAMAAYPHDQTDKVRAALEAPAEPRRSGVLIPSVNFEGESRKSKVIQRISS
jgi:hypothetical protein